MMADANVDWKTAELRDFLRLDQRLREQLPESYREGTHLALLAALLHSQTARTKRVPNRFPMNELSAFRFIRDHGDLTLSPETILSIYGSLLDGGAPAEWKKTNVFLEMGEEFYVTLPPEETPEAMAELCRQYAFLNAPAPEQFEEIFKFILTFICIHPFQDGNGRMSSLLMQFLLQKAGLRCAVFLPLDLMQNGVFMTQTSRRIRASSGAFYGMKPLEYEHYVPYMKELLAKSYQIMLDAAEKIPAAL